MLEGSAPSDPRGKSNQKQMRSLSTGLPCTEEMLISCWPLSGEAGCGYHSRACQAPLAVEGPMADSFGSGQEEAFLRQLCNE